MYALCVSGAMTTQGFVWNLFMRYIYIFIHSFIDILFRHVKVRGMGFLFYFARS